MGFTDSRKTVEIKPIGGEIVRLLFLYDKQNNKWLLVDMEFLFSCST